MVADVEERTRGRSIAAGLPPSVMLTGSFGSVMLPSVTNSTRILMKLGIAAGLGVIIWFLPAPEGVTTAAWHLFAIFVATIIGIVLEPLPMGVVALL